MLGINIHLIQSAAVTRLHEAVYAHTRGSILWESSKRACWLSMTCRWWMYGFSSWCSFEGTSLPARQEKGDGSESHALPASLSCVLQSLWCANPRGAEQSQERWPVTQRICCTMCEVTARYRKQEKKASSRQCWAASVHKGGTSEAWLFPSGRFIPVGSTSSPSPVRVDQGFLCAAPAAQQELEQGWAT